MLKILSQLAAGLVLFLYGMNIMSISLEHIAGGRLTELAQKMTRNRLIGFLSGLGITVIIQSSSALTVMLVGLVGAGVMSYSNSLGVIMGANVGTTVTAWLLSLNGISGSGFISTLLKPIVFSPIVALVCFFIRISARQNRRRAIADAFIGFALLIIGMDTMSSAVSFLKDSDAFSNVLTLFSNPIAAVIVATVFTGIIQSSSASVGIIQAISTTNTLTLSMSAPQILGANIGTCITALIASVGSNKNSKRVALLQVYFNIFGTIVFLPLFYLLPNIDALANVFSIAFLHTIFNVATTIVLIPFSKPIIALAQKTVHD